MIDSQSKIFHSLARALLVSFVLLCLTHAVVAETAVDPKSSRSATDEKIENEERRKRFMLGSFRAEGENKDSPIFIKSGTLTVNAKKRIFTYRKNVEIIQDDLHVTADTVVGTYDETNKIDRIECEDNVVITKGSGMRASSNRAVYFVKDERIALSEAPELFRDGNVLNADSVTIFLAEDRSEAEGNVRVKVLQTEAEANAANGLETDETSATDSLSSSSAEDING